MVESLPVTLKYCLNKTINVIDKIKMLINKETNIKPINTILASRLEKPSVPNTKYLNKIGIKKSTVKN